MTHVRYGLPYLLPALVSVVVLVTLQPACNQVQRSAPPATPQPTSSSKPPFATREPERYSATRVLVSEERLNDGRAPVVQTSIVKIFRDGAQRREEFQIRNGQRLVYLENDNGFFAISPDLKLFAPLSGNSNALNLEVTNEATWLTPVATNATYEDLGEEKLFNRLVRKFRVKAHGTSVGNGTSGDSIVWIDRELGMPIRTESETTEAGGRRRVVSEIRDVSFNVDAQLFRIPLDYLKVEAADIRARIGTKSQ